MKSFRIVLIILSTGFIFSSCQKEFTIETTTAKGSLQKDSSGDCVPSLVNGVYAKDSLIKASNYVDITVKITQTGSYSIKTDTVNGYSFSAAGEVGVVGLNTIRLQGKGRPMVAGTDVFKIKFDSSICEFNVTVSGTGGGGGSSAVYTLVGSPGTCTSAAQTNNFYAGISTNASNYVDIKANVTTAGTYSISTALVNGISFSATGTLAVGTNQNIRLLADGGMPTTAGSTFNYSLTTTAPASNCGFVLNVQPAPSPATFTFDCSTPQFFGTYQAGVSTAGDSVKILVTSTAGGSYSISSTQANNVTFTGSGVLSASVTPQSVTLYASAGSATASGPFSYTITGTGGSGTCNINQTYSAAPLGFITCTIDGIAKTFNNNAYAQFDNSMGIPTIGIYGQETAAMYPQLNLSIVDDAGITVFNYDANQAATGNIVGLSYYLTASTAFSGGTDPLNQSDPNPVKIYVTSLTPTVNPNRIKGTFSGPIKNGGVTKIVTLGNFDVPIIP